MMKTTIQDQWRNKVARLHAFLLAILTVVTIAACVSLEITNTNYIAESRALNIGFVGTLLLAIIGVVLICVSDTIGDKQTPHLLIRSTMLAIIFVVLYIFLVPAIQTAYSELSEKRPINDSRPLVCPR